MKLSSIAMAAALLLGQLSPSKPDMGQETLQVLAFTAQEVAGASGLLDEQLKPYKQLLDALAPSNTFQVIKSGTQPAIHGEVTTVSINALYWAEVKVSAPDEQGGIPMQVRIMYDDGSGPIEAINAQGTAQPNRAFTFRGMQLGAAELIVVLSFPQEQDGEGSDSDGEDSQQNQQNQDQQDQSQQEQQSDSESEQGESEQEEEEAPKLNQEDEQESQEAGEEEQEQMESEANQEDSEAEPKDDQTIEAILESLEEMDKEEQKNAHHRRSQVKFKSKGWW